MATLMTTSKQDRGSARTATELEQKYDLASIAGLKVAVKLSETGLNKTNAILEGFVAATLKSLENMQEQIDGSITTWFEAGVPTLANKPANEWTTEEDKNNHLGDLYYDQSSGYGYRFSLVNNAYEWTRITDNDIVKALAMAAAAQDTADSKRRVFIDIPAPPYDSGDLWLNGGDLYRCQISKYKYQVYEEKDFIIATKYTDDTYAIQVGNELKVLSGTVTTIKESFDSFKVDITTTVDTLDSQLLIAQTSIEANTEEISLKVDKNGVIGAINLSEESALIQARKINLVGAVTVSSLDSNLNSTITNASSSASNAVSTANATKKTLDSLCVLENNVTVIDGGKILTDSITAKQIKIDDLFSLTATIGGWKIKEKALYTDVLGTDNYLRRAFMQSFNEEDTWVYSVQKATTEGEDATNFYGLWYVDGNGNMYINGSIITSLDVLGEYVVAHNKMIVGGETTWDGYTFACHGAGIFRSPEFATVLVSRSGTDDANTTTELIAAIGFSCDGGPYGYIGMMATDGDLIKIDATDTMKYSIILDSGNYTRYAPKLIDFKTTRSNGTVALTANTMTYPWSKTVSTNKMVTIQGWVQFPTSGTYTVQIQLYNGTSWYTVSSQKGYSNANNLSFNTSVYLQKNEGIRLAVQSSVAQTATYYISVNS